jgi:hypothetical protein
MDVLGFTVLVSNSAAMIDIVLATRVLVTILADP